MIGKAAQLFLAAGLSYIVYRSLMSLSELWSSAPADVPDWVTMLSHYFPWVFFAFLAITILRI